MTKQEFLQGLVDILTYPIWHGYHVIWMWNARRKAMREGKAWLKAHQRTKEA